MSDSDGSDEWGQDRRRPTGRGWSVSRGGGRRL